MLGFQTGKQFLLGGLLLMGLTACGSAAAPAEPVQQPNSTGTLTFLANGEDFVRQGFISKDGWSINFEHVYVTLSDVAAYQTSPPYDASTGEAPTAEVSAQMAGPLTLDLAEGDDDAPPLTVDSQTVPTGQYNALSWTMTKATEGDSAGASIMLVGQATLDDQTVDFTLNVDRDYQYNCGEYVGDERKGFVEADSEGDIEATFHFDHVFGDADAPMDEGLNVGALGFQPLADVAQGGQLEASLTSLSDSLSAEDFTKLEDTLATLGHVGEGHCFEQTGGYTGAHAE